MELVVLPRSPFAGRSASDIRLRVRYGINLLALSRQGQRSMSRLRMTPIAPGDVLLMQGTQEALHDFAAQFECVPLAERSLRIPNKRMAITASTIMGFAVGGAALGLVPPPSRSPPACSPRSHCASCRRAPSTAVDWPVIVLLGALIPVADAMANTGAADQIAGLLLAAIAQGTRDHRTGRDHGRHDDVVGFHEQRATAAVMSPIAIQTAAQLGVSPDSFLMAVAVGASCAFLTPIGHQNNTLILGPGGFRFSDYWRLGLPLEILVVAIGVPMILWVWPL
jgi:di/tricarboxylate transporter